MLTTFYLGKNDRRWVTFIPLKTINAQRPAEKSGCRKRDRPRPFFCFAHPNVPLSRLDRGLFKTEFEKNLFKKIGEIKKYYSSINNDENYEKSLSILAGAKKEVFEFFDNVKVNEENENLRKNRLELINMLCKTFQNFTNFQLLKINNE